jgi:lipoprotein-anchoring transpeptidase ErfK/SrfK
MVTIIIGILVTILVLGAKPLQDFDSQMLISIVSPVIDTSEIDTTNIPSAEKKDTSTPAPLQPLFEYGEIINSCDINFKGTCVRVRSGPGTEYPVVARLRNTIVLKIGDKIERDGILWYKIIFDEYIQYPNRIQGDWYIASDNVGTFFDEGDETIWDSGRTTVSTTSKKEIIINRTEQKLFAYEGELLFMEIPVSTGLTDTPTPRGIFTIFKKTPSRYMQGPLKGLSDQQYYDLPGVPWNLYFTYEGAVIHGAYWHNSFGKTYSHGCVNLLPENARKLYLWAELGTKVIVKD